VLTSVDRFLEFVEPYVTDAAVLVVGTKSWVRESGLLHPLQTLARTVTLREPYVLARGGAQGVFDAVILYERLQDPADAPLAAARLREGGVVVADAFTPDQFDDRSLRWWVDRLREHGIERTPSELHDEWNMESREFATHPSYASLRRALDEHFTVRHFEWLPAFHEGDVFEVEDIPDELWDLEEAAVARGEIAGLGFRYAGERRL